MTHSVLDFFKRRWFAALVLGSLLLHLVLFLAFQPWGQTTMRFDQQEHDERIEQVALREELRREEEHQRRQKLRLTPEHAEQLKRREDQARQERMRENVLKLARARKEAMREREEAFDRLEKREPRELLPDQLERLKENLRLMTSAAHEVTRESKVDDEKFEIRARAGELVDEVDELQRQARDPEQAEPDYQKKTAEIAELARQWEEKYKEWGKDAGGSRESRTGDAERRAGKLAEEAGELAKGVDTATLNDTSTMPPIGEPPPASTPEGVAEADPAELYEAAVELEKQVIEADRQARAAELAVLEGESLAQAERRIEAGPPSRPDLAGALRGEASGESGKGEPASETSASGSSDEQAKGDAGETADGEKSGDAEADTDDGDGGDGASASSASSSRPAGIETVGDLNRYREAISTATSETSDMARGAERRTGDREPPTGVRARAKGDAAAAAHAAAMADASRNRRGGKVVDMVGLQMANWRGGGEGDEVDLGLRADMTGLGGEMMAGRGREGNVRLNGSKVIANALPGRMLTDDSARAGFLYLDTWYMIGPWNNWSKADFAQTHPPEQRIDLDAVYRDGKDGSSLRWKFVQSDKIAIEPPTPTWSATYYAYTEVYSDKTREMLVAVASDDMAKVWLNGDVIWTDVGQSSWNLDEGFRRVIFRKGFNAVLVRIENGPSYVAFSLVLCPPSVVQTSQE